MKDPRMNPAMYPVRLISDAQNEKESMMSRISMKRSPMLLLAIAALFGASGCRQDLTAVTAFGLGYLLGGWGTGQTVSTCFVNGTEVDCGTLPEHSP